MELLRGEDKLEEETPQPIITIQVGEERLVTQAFIDSGANGITMSYELYKQLKGVEIQKTTTTFKSFIGQKIKQYGTKLWGQVLCHPSGIVGCAYNSW